MAEYSDFVYSSLREIIHVLFRHKGKIVATFLIVAFLAAAGVYVWPATYQSQAALMMRIGRENMPDDPAVENTLVQLAQDRTSEVRSIIAVLESDELARKVVEEIGEGWILGDPNLPRKAAIEGTGDYTTLVKRISGALSGALKGVLYALDLKKRLEPADAALDTLRGGLEVEVDHPSNIVRLSFDHEEPAVAQAVLDGLIGQYEARHRVLFASQVTPTFFEEKVSSFQTALSDSEKALQDFRMSNNISEIQAQKETLLAQISDLEGQLADAGASYQSLVATVAALEEATGRRPKRHETSRTTGMPNFAADKLKDKMIDLRVAEQEMASKYTDAYQPLRDLRDEIALVERQMREEPEFLTEITTGLDANTEGLEHRLDFERANVAGGKARLENLQLSVASMKEELARLAGTEAELQRLERARGLAEAEYRDYREKLVKANLTQSLDQGNVINVRTVEAASKPLEPESPKKLRTIGLGLLLGVFLGVALAFLLEYFDDTLGTPEDVERWIRVPVLASLSEQEFRKCT